MAAPTRLARVNDGKARLTVVEMLVPRLVSTHSTLPSRTVNLVLNRPSPSGTIWSAKLAVVPLALLKNGTEYKPDLKLRLPAPMPVQLTSSNRHRKPALVRNSTLLNWPEPDAVRELSYSTTIDFTSAGMVIELESSMMPPLVAEPRNCPPEMPGPVRMRLAAQPVGGAALGLLVNSSV